jgi:hypothetical protein
VGRVAQLVEQCPFKAWVAGSSPAALTTHPFREIPTSHTPIHLAQHNLRKVTAHT